MSESVSNNGESPSYNQSYKYSSSFQNHSSESPTSSESVGSSFQQNFSKEKQINETKVLLKNTETNLIENLKKENLHNEVNSAIELFRNMIVDNEEQIIKSPTSSTLQSCYMKIYQDLTSQNKSKTFHLVLLKTLEDEVKIERKNKSSLKYW